MHGSVLKQPIWAVAAVASNQTTELSILPTVFVNFLVGK
jgi:hypothetical protein